MKDGRKTNSSYNITEGLLRYAIQVSLNAHDCAKFLNISYTTFKKYAQSFVNSETGKTYFELIRDKQKETPTCYGSRKPTEAYITNIINGKVVNHYTEKKFREALILYGFLEEKCSVCGYSDRRILDYQMPLTLDWIDGNRFNGRLENVRLLCYNDFSNSDSLM